MTSAQQTGIVVEAPQAHPEQVSAPGEELQLAERVRQLTAEIDSLRRRLTWRTVALELLLLAVAGISSAIWLTRWWPWE